MKTKFIVFIITFFLVFKSFAFATAPLIISHPDTINPDSSFTITATMSGLSAQTIYRLRIALSQNGTSNYFGSTYNGNDWYNGTPSPIDYSKFFMLTTNQDGSWNGDILGKFESTDTNYNGWGSGNYDLKLGRYTQNGSTATWSDVASIRLNAPSATPTNSPTQKPTPSNTQTPTPTNILSPTNTPQENSLSGTEGESDNITSTANDDKSVLGNKTQISPSLDHPTDNLKNATLSASDNTILPKLLILIGIVFLASCGIVIFYPTIKRMREEKLNG